LPSTIDALAGTGGRLRGGSDGSGHGGRGGLTSIVETKGLTGGFYAGAGGPVRRWRVGYGRPRFPIGRQQPWVAHTHLFQRVFIA